MAIQHILADLKIAFNLIVSAINEIRYWFEIQFFQDEEQNPDYGEHNEKAAIDIKHGYVSVRNSAKI
jgi:hypothetical protein